MKRVYRIQIGADRFVFVPREKAFAFLELVGDETIYEREGWGTPASYVAAKDQSINIDAIELRALAADIQELARRATEEGGAK